ncbi:hypothetical protein [Caballeronia sp. Lep1P3]|uniref:hypothetical protein n=1 Tax=Caballeronia sp. Lep1P3 TaxID=2878150 RepID=UPI001FD486CA|nr:hypothetical protein [Caballeronia sp. Lep1P3]
MKTRHLVTVAAAALLVANGAALAQEQSAPMAGAPHTTDSSTATYGASTYRGSDYGGAAYGGDNSAGARNYGDWVRGRNPANCPAGLACNVYKGS